VTGIGLINTWVFFGDFQSKKIVQLVSPEKTREHIENIGGISIFISTHITKCPYINGQSTNRSRKSVLVDSCRESI